MGRRITDVFHYKVVILSRGSTGVTNRQKTTSAL